MATSQEFKTQLNHGNIAGAIQVALGEMIELKIRTRVVPAEADGAAGDQPGHQMQTRINIVDGDIETEVGSLFLQDGPYSELRSFHTQQVVQAQGIIRTNIESLQALLGILIQASGKSAPWSSLPETTIVSDVKGSEDFSSEDSGLGLGIAATGITATAATMVGFSSFSGSEEASVESLEPIALTADELEPEAFAGLMDGSPDEDLADFGTIDEPLGNLADSEVAAETSEDAMESGFSSFGFEAESPLDFSEEIEPSSGFRVDSGTEALASEDTSFEFGGDFESELEAESPLSFSEPMEPSLELSEDVGAAASEDTSFEFGGDFESEFEAESPLDFSEPIEASLELSEDFGTEAPEATSSETAAFDFSGEEETDFSMEFSNDAPLEEDMTAFEEPHDLEMSFSSDLDTPEPSVQESSFSSFGINAPPEGESQDENDISFLDFEDPIDALDALDIPEDVPDPLADLHFLDAISAPDDERMEDLALGQFDDLSSEPATIEEVTPDPSADITNLTDDGLDEFGTIAGTEAWGMTDETFEEDPFAVGGVEDLSKEDFTNDDFTQEDRSADVGLGLSLEDDISDLGAGWEMESMESAVTESSSFVPEVLMDASPFSDSFSEDEDLNEALDEMEDLGSLDEMDDFEADAWDEAQAGTPIGELGLSDEDVEWDDAVEAMGDLDDFEDMALMPDELSGSGLSLETEDPHFGEAMGVADVDAMDSLFQNSQNNLDLEDFQTPAFSSQAASDLDPFDLEVDDEDPFEVLGDEDPFGSMSLEDNPLPPPPPPPRR